MCAYLLFIQLCVRADIDKGDHLPFFKKYRAIVSGNIEGLSPNNFRSEIFNFRARRRQKL